MAPFLLWAIIVPILLAVTKRDFSTYGVSPRNVRLDLAVAAIWLIPLCLLDSLSAIDISSAFTIEGLVSLILLLAIVALLRYVTAKLSDGYGKDKIARAALISMPAVALCAFIFIPFLLLPGTVKFTPQSIDYFVLAFAFVGPVEELVFRGYIQSRLNEAFGRPYRLFGASWGAGLVIASLLFGVLHVFNGFNPFIGKYTLDLPYGVIAFLMGLTMGMIREKTGSIVAPAILHGAIDFIEAIF